jgi:predicted nucleic acid-binding protein
MIGSKLLVDTNIILYLLNGDETIADFLQDKELFISFITELELLSFWDLSTNEEKYIQSFIQNCKSISMNELIKKETLQIRKNYKMKLPDSIIAATSLYLDIPLISADLGFQKIENLSFIQYEL